MLKAANQTAHAVGCVLSASEALKDASSTLPFNELNAPIKRKLQEIAVTLSTVAANISGANVVAFPSQEESCTEAC